MTEVGITLAEVILELLGSFTLERRAFRYLSRENDSTHHVGFPLSPFPDLLCIHGYHSTLYTVEPLLSGHLLSSHPPSSVQ